MVIGKEHIKDYRIQKFMISLGESLYGKSSEFSLKTLFVMARLLTVVYSHFALILLQKGCRRRLKALPSQTGFLMRIQNSPHRVTLIRCRVTLWTEFCELSICGKAFNRRLQSFPIREILQQ